jgi:dienelactone hydrolase
VLVEMPGISPQVLGFADRLVAIGCSVVLPDLFGEAGRDPLVRSTWRRSQYALASMLEVCVSREFTLFATGRSSKVVDYLRGLAKHEHARCGGPGVGVVGMCFTGGFALAMATAPSVIAPVMSQPSLPFPVTERRKRAIDCSAGELEHIASRCSKEGLRVLGLRFKGDPIVPAERFALLRERLGDGFVAIELEQQDGHPRGPLPKHHSVLTVDLIDEPGEPTLAALQQVLDLMRSKLLSR